jgi:hypothetical protein
MSVKLYKKLAAAIEEFDPVLKDKTNPYYNSKYADINGILDAVVPSLKKHNLLLLQPAQRDQVTTIIIDLEDGAQIMSSIMIPPSVTDPQKIGAAITYFRRFTLQALLGLQAEDDDGNSLSPQASKFSKTSKPTVVPKIEVKAETSNDNASSPPPFRRKLGKPVMSAISSDDEL